MDKGVGQGCGIGIGVIIAVIGFGIACFCIFLIVVFGSCGFALNELERIDKSTPSSSGQDSPRKPGMR